MSKNQRKGFRPETDEAGKLVGAAAELVAGKPSDEILQFALRTLAEQPGYAEAARADADLSEAKRLEDLANEILSQRGTRSIRLKAVVEPQALKLRRDLDRWENDLKTQIMESDDITTKRVEQGSFFRRWLENVVAAAVKQDSVASRMQSELQNLVAEAIEIEKLNERADADVANYRKEAASLAKEADEILASIQI